MRRLIVWMASTVVVTTPVVIILDLLLHRFSIDGVSAAVATVLAFAVIPALAWPFVYRISAAIHPVLFPVMTFVIGGLVVLGTASILSELGIQGVLIDGLWTGVVIAFGLPLISILIATLFSLDDNRGYGWFVERPLHRKLAATPRTTEPGILFLEIDGLAEPVLREAMSQGYLPTIARWVERGSHVITPWETDLSSQTAASQAGLLLGDNTDIPAFRWWDRSRGQLMVTSNAADVRLVEAELAAGDSLLINHGASRWNVFSGEATDSIATFSTFGIKRQSNQSAYFMFFSNLYLLARVLGLFIVDVIRERIEAWQQRRHNARPRIDRRLGYALIRAATTTLMQEASRYMLISDIFRGVPAVYNTFYAYDEVAHHSGIRSRDAYKVLKRIDRVIDSIERAAAHGPRPYYLVILSDHGQSPGAPFRQRFGVTLDELVRSLLAPDAEVFAQLASREGVTNLELTLNEALALDRRTMRMIRRARRTRMLDQTITLSPGDEPSPDQARTEASTSDVVVLASGNLGLISFPQAPERLTLEVISARYPYLIEGLRGHPGIGFVAVQSARSGWLVIGRRGVNLLDLGTVSGENPLEQFGPRAASLLKRELSFSNAPDILVMSMFDPASNEVAAFEELVGSHGGLGGPQSQAFVVHPIELVAGPDPICGSVAVHRILKRWRAELQCGERRVIDVAN